MASLRPLALLALAALCGCGLAWRPLSTPPPLEQGGPIHPGEHTPAEQGDVNPLDDEPEVRRIPCDDLGAPLEPGPALVDCEARPDCTLECV